jgi:hypothetical protein
MVKVASQKLHRNNTAMAHSKTFLVIFRSFFCRLVSNDQPKKFAPDDVETIT